MGQPTTLAVDTKTPYNIYIGLQDNGTMRVPSNYVPGRSDASLWKSIGGGDGSNVVVDPREGTDIVYTASQFGSSSAQDAISGKRWSTRPRGQGERFNWVSPLILSPHHPEIVYAGSQRVFRSFDQGRTYKPISPDLTRNRPNGDVPYSTLKDISESPLKFGLILVGADDGSVKFTPNSGFEWKSISTPEPFKWVSRVIASKYDEKVFIVAQNGYREDDFAPYLWRSEDQGKTWKSIVGNLPNEPINVVREDPENGNVLYVGTDAGVYITFDGGKKWEAIYDGMGTQPVHDLQIQPKAKDLVVATHSRGVYIVNLEKVFAVTDAMRKAPITILNLEEGSRSATWGYDRKQPFDASPP